MGLTTMTLLATLTLHVVCAPPPGDVPPGGEVRLRALCYTPVRPMALLGVGGRDYLVEAGWRSPDERLVVDDVTRDGLRLRQDDVARRLSITASLPDLTRHPVPDSPSAPGLTTPDPTVPDPAVPAPAVPDRLTVVAVAVDVGDLMQMIGRSTGLTLVCGPTVTGATTIQATDLPRRDMIELVAATHDARVSTSPLIPGAFVVSRHTLDDVVFDPAVDPAARPTSVKMRPSRITDILRLVAVSAGVRLRFPLPIDATMAVEMTGVRPLEALRLVAAAAGLDVRLTAEPGVLDVTPATRPRPR